MSSLLSPIPVFQIEEESYTFKRLGIKAVFDLLEVAKNAWKAGVLDLNIHLEHLRLLSPTQEAADQFKVTPDLLLFFTVDHCLDDFLNIMDTYLLNVTDPENKRKVTRETLEDEENFPAYSLITLALYFLAHPDISMFIANFNEGKQLPFVQAVMGKAQDLNPS